MQKIPNPKPQKNRNLQSPINPCFEYSPLLLLLLCCCCWVLRLLLSLLLSEMRIARVLFGSLEGGLPRPCQHLQSVRFLSTGNGFDGQRPNSNSFEPDDEFERRIFCGY
ncbi:uncharacterized protein LOC111302124 [Durio zibethinus]|uniref:Uncharacterized protein LOC111302124 n=1 Tax=Durio zibethinus TaxID=66656 RepID=A0A6P5ZN91_DURZI|nr:uncharacterized protein LOC111302124 [Durio zibethinus]